MYALRGACSSRFILSARLGNGFSTFRRYIVPQGAEDLPAITPEIAYDAVHVSIRVFDTSPDTSL